MVTKHPSYASNMRINAYELTEIIQPYFWTEGIMAKRLWGRLLPEKLTVPVIPKKLVQTWKKNVDVHISINTVLFNINVSSCNINVNFNHPIDGRIWCCLLFVLFN